MTTVPPERAKALVEIAKAKNSDELAGFLDGLAAIDPDVRKEVEELLASEDGATSVTADRPTAIKPAGRDTGERIGPYRILREIGEGGMGIVYEAEQQEPVRRKVALKLIKWGMDTKAVIGRFESERQALALMNHPNIASVFDAGATPEGRPYFAMEYVQGIPITHYCDKHLLTIKERLELFILVCEGVQHAHQKGIIHRDIKPSNVLVAVQDDKPVPKIIDFGVAKATSQRLTEHTVATELSQLIGTPEYMSPEQAEMTNLDIDTRTDVYSLGVLLYELLVGAHPFDPHELRAVGLAEIQRKLREEEPPRPSTRVSALGEASTASASNRRVEVRALERQLRGDLDWVTMKALEKDRTRRYETANAMALDVERYLNNERIRARAPSATYRMGRFVRRHRVGVSVGAGFVFVLLGVVILTLVQSARIAQERDRAELEAAKATAISDFLQATLGPDSFDSVRGQKITVVEALATAERRIESSFRGRPELTAAVKATIGNAYGSLGRYDEGEALLISALDIQTSTLGRRHLAVAETLLNLGSLRSARRDHQKADYTQAEKNLAEALAIRRELVGNESLEVPEILLAQGVLMQNRGGPDVEQRERLYREAWRIQRKLMGDENGEVADTMRLLADALTTQEDHEAAERLYLESLNILRRLDDHTGAKWVALNNLGQFYRRLEKHDLSAKYLREALDEARRKFSDRNPALTMSIYNLASILNSGGSFEEAEVLAREALSRSLQEHPEGHLDLGIAYAVLATTLSGLERLDESERCYREALRLFREHGASQSRISLRQGQYGLVLMKLRRFEDSESELLTALKDYLDTYPERDRHQRVIQMLTGLVELYESWGKPEKAAEYRALLEESWR